MMQIKYFRASSGDALCTKMNKWFKEVDDKVSIANVEHVGSCECFVYYENEDGAPRLLVEDGAAKCQA